MELLRSIPSTFSTCRTRMHSLAAVIFWSTVAGFVTYRVTLARPRWPVALIVGATVFSHWILDFLVHRPVLPLYGDRLKIGMGLYHWPALALGLEVALLFGGVYLYMRKTKPLERVRRFGAIILGIVITGIFGYVSFAPPLPTIKSDAAWALVIYVVLAAVAYWIERKPV